MYSFVYKHKLTDEEYMEYFEFMKSFLKDLYGESALTQASFVNWRENQKKIQDITYVKMMKGEKCCGYADFVKTDDSTIHCCNVVVKEEERRTRLILKFLIDLINNENYKNYSAVTMHINRKNGNSFSTWSRFNYELIAEEKFSNKYKITRKNIENYLKNYKK